MNAPQPINQCRTYPSLLLLLLLMLLLLMLLLLLLLLVLLMLMLLQHNHLLQLHLNHVVRPLRSIALPERAPGAKMIARLAAVVAYNMLTGGVTAL